MQGRRNQVGQARQLLPTSAPGSMAEPTIFCEKALSLVQQAKLSMVSRVTNSFDRQRRSYTRENRRGHEQ